MDILGGVFKLGVKIQFMISNIYSSLWINLSLIKNASDNKEFNFKFYQLLDFKNVPMIIHIQKFLHDQS